MRLAGELRMEGDEKGQKQHQECGVSQWEMGNPRGLAVYCCILAVCVGRDIGVVSRIILQNTHLESSLVSSCLSIPHLVQNYHIATELVGS